MLEIAFVQPDGERMPHASEVINGNRIFEVIAAKPDSGEE